MSADVVERPREIANAIVKRVLRRAMGLYYVLWSTFPMSVALTFAASEDLGASATAMYAVFIALIAVYVAVTARIFALAARAAKLQAGKRPGWAVLIAVLTFLVALALLRPEVGALANGAYGTAVAAFLYLTVFRVLKPRFYDHMALIPFPILMALSYFYNALYFAIGITWAYAGAASLSEL
ncbi:hypothetical protein ODS41_07330 [Pyrobaculum sp. 3827-6]|uniref:hypothetical protein n=1 Tax=Pyrobaculum sp. 3827-6 TaxID=2983604 RepID=UPI0021DA02A4|nr:hypothetical protein [Pyrobaculum sp. 3827-6]MCU7787725.1 hypothetical protein [Pyrobaculum sp. 3827-6]